MLRVNVGLSRKLSKDYNSTGYSINIDGEVTAAVSDPEAVIEQVKELFDLAEESLAQQIERAQGETSIASRDGSPVENGHARPGQSSSQTNGTQRQPLQHQNGNGHRDPDPATNKQMQYLLTIGKRQQLSTIELEQKITGILGHAIGLYDLSKQQAATVIDALNGNGATRARR